MQQQSLCKLGYFSCGIVEVIGLCGYYTMVSMTLNTFEFELPPGEVSELA